MRQALIIARYTFKEIIQSKVLLNVFFLGLGLILIAYVGKEFTYGVPEKVALDFGLGALGLSSVAIAIFLGVGLISSEIESRTLYMILSRPVRRWQFVLGRLLGLKAILIINILVLALMTLSTVAFMGGNLSSLVYWVIVFSMIEALIMMAMTVFFSLVTNKTMAVIYSVLVFILGHALGEAKNIRFAQNNDFIMGLLNVYSSIFPNLSKLNVKDFVLYQTSLEPNLLISILGYGVLYLAAIVFVNCYIFTRKNLD